MELVHALERLSHEARDFGACELDYHDGPPTPLEFLRMIHVGRPVIITNVATKWPAMKKWTDRNYLESTLGSNPLTVAVTPNGLADAVVGDRFVLPHEASMTFSEFASKVSTVDVDEIRGWKEGDVSSGVHYIQTQNNNIHGEFKNLLQDVPESIAFADEAIGEKPEAVNFWIGSTHAVTSTHKDHYENLYVVISGEKEFVLIPPTDTWRLNGK
ncbi:JmjC domain-containing protein 7 [Dinochytrium kinnereticum]|nr:JmjC domain-containing protein 7 [Dinochytrium kinnereticum]